MAKYLIIGLTTTYRFNKEEAQSVFGSTEAAIDYVVNNYAPSELYNVYDIENCIYFLLKSDILESELASFLDEFYTLRYNHPTSGGYKEIVKGAKTLQYEQVLEFARYCRDLSNMSSPLSYSFDCFRFDYSWENLHYSSINGGIIIKRWGIDLSRDGDLIKEPRYWEELLQFFTNIIQEKFDKYKLSKALVVTVS